jgi:hypothetical protein
VWQISENDSPSEHVLEAGFAAAALRWLLLRRVGRPTPSNRFRAVQFASNALPVVREIQKAGMTTLREIAQALNARGVQTARGGTWAPQTVANLMKRQQS